MLKDKLGSSFQGQSLDIQLGYNATHLGGLGDKIESVTQAFANPVSDYDLDTILTQIQPEVTTRKILLVGHSQGTFYTNEMYQYLVTHGVPKESIGVYNIATPASEIAGGGGYLTSTNDKLVNGVRDAENNGNLQIYLNSYYVHTQSVVSSALRANITLPKEAGWDTDDYGGHHFAVYLDEGGDRIVGDIDRELSNLKASGGDSSDACFTAPIPTLADKIQTAEFSVADPVTDAAAIAIAPVADAGAALLSGGGGMLASVSGALQNLAEVTSNKNIAAAVGSVIAKSQTSSAALPTEATSVQKSTAPASVAGPAKSPVPSPKTSSATGNPTTPSSTTQSQQSNSPAQQFSITPGFGGGGGGATSQSGNSQSSAVPFMVSSPQNGSAFATTSVIFSGTTAAGATITATFATSSATTTADAGGNWSLPLSLPEGTISITTSAVSGSVTSAGDTRNVIVDLTPPATSTIAVADCSASLLASSCLIPTTTTTVSWSAASGASYYALVTNSTLGATTTSLSATASLVSGATTAFAVVAYDEAGNAATSSSLDVAGISQPLIINEIGWGGVGESDFGTIDHSVQWVEIKNLSSYTLDLSHVILRSSAGTSIPLSGTLPPTVNQNFLVVTPNQPNLFGANVITTAFALATTTAEQLSLVWNTATTLDASPAVATCAGWCAGAYLATIGTNIQGLGDFTSPRSMERKSNADGTLASSWQTNDAYSGITAYPGNTHTFWGTPAGDNSIGLPDVGVYCGSVSNLILPSAPPGPSFSPLNNCTFLAHFLTPGVHGAQVFAGVFRGDVGSSTGGVAFSLNDVPLNVANQNPQIGDHFFFAIGENRSFGNDNVGFNLYFTEGASTTLSILPPHGNYVTIPFTYSQ